MSVFKNNIHSSPSEIPGDNVYGNNGYAGSNYFKKGSGNQYNNNIHRADYITLPKSRSDNEYGTCPFWTLVVLLFILALGNLILTYIILGVLRLGQGMESLELVPEESLIKFFGNTDLDRIYKRDGKIESFNESPMEILGDAETTHFGIVDGDRHLTPTLEFDKFGFGNVKNVESLEVKHSITGESIFSTNFPNFGLPRGVNKLDVKVVSTKRITSPVDDALMIKSDKVTKLTGSEGTHIDSKEIIWSADQDIFLKSVNKSLILSGYNGTYINVKSLPIANTIKDLRAHMQYKVCVCMPSGKLYRIQVRPGQAQLSACTTIDASGQNPCT